MSHISVKNRIIEKLGGQTVVASICGITQSAVSQWGEYIPSKYIGKLVAAGAKPEEFCDTFPQGDDRS